MARFGEKPTTIHTEEDNSVELKTVTTGSVDFSKAKPRYSIDITYRGCPISVQENDSVENKEDQSLPMSTVDDNPITLNKNKNSNGIAYKGLMDIALLTANANQLRLLFAYNKNADTFYISVSLVVASLILQVAIGIGLIFEHQMERKGKVQRAGRTNSLILSGIFCLTVINVLVVSFTTTPEEKQKN